MGCEGGRMEKVCEDANLGQKGLKDGFCEDCYGKNKSFFDYFSN
jgi:hypothetical protein